MPRVPTLAPARILADPRPQVRQQAPDADAFGAGLGQGLEQASRTAFGVWNQEVERINESRVLESDTEAARHEVDTWKALEQQQGNAAPQAFNDALDGMRKRNQEIEGKLSNEAQREAFRRSSARRMQAFENRGASYVVGETRRADKQASDANLALGLEQVAASRNDWQTAAKLTEDTISKRVAYLRRNGTDDAEIQRQVGVLRSTATRSVAEGLIADDNDMAAKRLVDQYGGYLTEDDRTALAGRLKLSSTKGEAMRLADKAFSDKLDATAGRAWLIEQAGDNPELRDMAVQRWENHRAAAERAVADDQHAAAAEAFAMLENPANDYASLPVGLMARLEKRTDIKERLSAFASKKDRLLDKDESTKELVRLQVMAYEDPEQFKKIDPMSLVGKLPNGDIEQMTAAIMQMRVGKPGKELRGITSVEKAMQLIFQASGLKPDDTSDLAMSLRGQLYEEAAAFEEQHQRPANGDELLKMGIKLRVKVAMPGEGSNPTKPLFERNKLLLDRLPQERRDALIRRLGYAGALEESAREVESEKRIQEDERRKLPQVLQDRPDERGFITEDGISLNPEDW